VIPQECVSAMATEKNEPPSVPPFTSPWVKSPEHDVQSNDAENLHMMGAGSRFAVANVVGFREIREKSELLLQTVIVPGDKTSEGQLIEAVTIVWFDIIALLQKDPSIAFQIPWRKWEEIIAGAYDKAGFDEVTLTSRRGDYGRDVIAVKKGLGSVRVIDQVKAYGPGHPVEADDVRALVGVLYGDSATSKGVVVVACTA
jgi:restriction system protein